MVFDSSTEITPLAADLFHGIRHHLPNSGIVMGGDGGDLSLFLARLDRTRQRAQRLDRRFQPAVEPALDIDGAGARHDIADAVGENGVRQKG